MVKWNIYKLHPPNLNMEKKELDIILVPEGEGKNKIYSISSIQFPNVVTQGKSINEARIRLKEALKLYFDDPSQKSL